MCFDPAGGWLYHVDLGCDQIIAHRFDPAAGFSGAPVVGYHAPPGSGPRHLVFHPVLPLALLASELASTLSVLQVGDGRLLPRQVLSTLPDGFTEGSLAGYLTLNAAGDRAYVTNRGHDSSTMFSWDADCVLAPLQHMPSDGASPRSIVLLKAQRQLGLANEEGGNFVVFDILADGTLAALATRIAVPGAVFVVVDPVDRSHGDTFEERVDAVSTV